MKNKNEIRCLMGKAVIEELGGVKAVLQIFPDLSQPSISQWKIRGLPVDKERYLRVLRPDLQTWKDYEFKAGA